MAVYNLWSDPLTLQQLHDDLAEIYASIPEVTVNDITSGTAFSITLDADHGVLISTNASGCGVYIKPSNVTVGGNSTAGNYQYYAKPNGEVLIVTTGLEAYCVQWCIGKTSDGDWGAVCLGHKLSANPRYDLLIATGSGVVNTEPRYVTNAYSYNVNFIGLRRCVKYADILFDNIYINTEGYIASQITFELGGDRYVGGTTNNGNNDILCLKL